MLEDPALDTAGFFNGSIIVITGGVGSVGTELARQLLRLDVSELRLLDNNESGLFEAEQKHAHDPHVRTFHADITNELDASRYRG